VAIVSVLNTYPRSVQDRLSDLREGVPAKCKFLPTVADIVEIAGGENDEFSSARDLARRIGKL
jgi:hypothetical protein